MYSQCHASFYGLYDENDEFVKFASVSMYEDITPWRIEMWQPYTLKDTKGNKWSIRVRDFWNLPLKLTEDEYITLYFTLIDKYGFEAI